MITPAGSEVRADERMQLVIPGDEPLGTRRDIALVQPPVGLALDQPGHDDGPGLAGDAGQGGDRRPVGDRLGQGVELLAGERLEERIGRDAALVEADDLGAVGRGPSAEVADAAEVVRLVAVAVLELGGGDADVAHGAVGSGVLSGA